MKKYLVIVSLVIGLVSLGLLFGCAQVTETTTTTTIPAITSAQVNTAKTAVLVTNGGIAMGNSAASIGSANTNVKAGSVKAQAGGPPDSFFTENLLTSTDGYLRATTEAVGGNMTPYLKLLSKGGDPIFGSFLQNKKIAKFITVETRTIFSGGPGQAPPGISEEVYSYIGSYSTAYFTPPVGHPFSNSSIFSTAETMADYLLWSHVFPSMEAEVNSYPGLRTHIYFVTPEATTNDKIGGMEMKMAFTKAVTGEVKIAISTELGGKPIPGPYSGSGKLLTPVGTMDATVSLVHGADGPPTSVTFVGTTEATTPIHMVKVYMSPSTMTATGEVFKKDDGTWTRIGTIEGTSSGGKVYIGATSEAFSF